MMEIEFKAELEGWILYINRYEESIKLCAICGHQITKECYFCPDMKVCVHKGCEEKLIKFPRHNREQHYHTNIKKIEWTEENLEDLREKQERLRLE